MARSKANFTILQWLNGNELCDRLGIGKPSFYYWILMAGQVLFFMAICYTYRAIPLLDQRKNRVSGCVVARFSARSMETSRLPAA